MVPFNALTDTRYGRMLYHIHDLYIGRALEWFGEFSPGEMDLYRHLLKAGDVVVEAGANIGALTLPIAQCVGDAGRVYAFEPQRLTYQALCGNLALNSITNTTALNLAVGAAMGEIHAPRLDLGVEQNIGAVTLEPDGPPNMSVTTIDFYGFPRVDLLKLDVEGMEYEILCGAENTVMRRRPRIVAELEREAAKPRVIHWMVEHDYLLYGHYPPLSRVPNWRGVDRDPWPGVVSWNVLAVPAECEQPSRTMQEEFGLLDLQQR